MKRTATMILGFLFLAAAALPAAIEPASGSEETALVAAGPVPPAIDDEEDMGEEPAAFPDVRVVVAAPRAALTGRVGGVLTMARPGRTVNVEEGETVRFVSGVKEAVWYAGAGAVESSLLVLRAEPDGTTTPLGRDQVFLRGAAPKIDAGRARVDVPFPQAGEFTLGAVVRVASIPREGRGMSRVDRARYQVRVWPTGGLGGVTGFVGDEADGSPLPGMRVVALDLVNRILASVAYTRCDGTYDLRRLPPGDYLIAVRGRRGFAGEFYDDASDPAAATPVTVAAGAATPGIDFLLARP